ncbi:MAG: TetR/AcrR family transcriptional regulator [Coriobacteriales bacterium]|jgi:AcrR family transcriptional regulator
MRTGPLSKKAQATRETLLKAALEVMAEKGYAEATIDDIAKRAGVSKGLAYYHFRNKRAIAEEIIQNGLNELVERFEGVAQRCKTGVEALKGMLNEFSDMILGNWRFGKFYLSTLLQDGNVWGSSIDSIDSNIISLIKEQFARGKEEGSIRKEVDPEFCAVACVGLVLMSCLRYLGKEDEPTTATREFFTSSIIDFVSNATMA